MQRSGKRAENQPNYLLEYLSLAPVLAVVSVSVAISTWIIFNAYFPDLLFHPMP
ncbi:PsaJ protein [Leptolyngbya ohadii]|uniref:PsaJ protein n=1 Tax=Leptolyngbya ohadii TaxID=1962290 RepID=UPI000B59F270|nr:PsaJ protein [Leptolyngbya ohadii]